MNQRLASYVCAFLGLALTSNSANAANRQVERLLAMTPADYVAKATVKDDSLETTATVTTLNGFQEKQGLLGIVWNDVFLRGFVDKATGRTTYQLYAILYSSGGGWPFFNQVNIALPGGTRTISVDRVGSDVDCSRYGCTHTEQVVFELDESAMRSVAATYAAGAPNGIAMRFKGQGGIDIDMVIMPAEFAGFLQVMDNVSTRYARRITPPSAPAPAMAPATATPAAGTSSPRSVSPAKLKSPAHTPLVTQPSATAVQNAPASNPHVRCITCR